jgi:hypothetical protein
MEVKLNIVEDSYNTDCEGKTLNIEIRNQTIGIYLSDDERIVYVNKEKFKKICRLLED